MGGSDERGDERQDDFPAGMGVIRALLIAGPTASGKSALAIALAKRWGARIVNADSMQVYRDWRILTARPTPDEEAQAPHVMFGTIDGAENFSVGRWLERARALLAEDCGPLIFVGGTGLFFKAMTEGLSELPEVPDGVRETTRAEAVGVATPDLHAKLAALDPLTAANLRPSDRQRVIRALEIFAAVGVPLAAMQGARKAPALAPGEWRGLFIAPERRLLVERIDARFDAMLRLGALIEAEAMRARALDPALPAMRAHGAPHLIAHLHGRLPLSEAAELSKRDTRRYAKRQMTWGRNQMPGFVWSAPEGALKAALDALQISPPLG